MALAGRSKESEDLLLEGLAVTRAIHDRYHPSRRNPWNEVRLASEVELRAGETLRIRLVRGAR